MNILDTTKLMFTAVLMVLVSMATPVMAQNNCGFDNWDGDSSDFLDNTEFSTALTEVDYFAVWDADGDSTLTEDEWNTGVNGYFSMYDTDAYGEYDEWDTDGDNVLTEDEFDNGLFDTVDDDDTDTIDQDEWDLFDEEEDGLFC